MATGLSLALANTILNHYRGGATWTPPAGFFVKLHLGDPGAAGTANPATTTTRQQGTFGSSSGGAIANTGVISWTGLTVTGATETITHVSVWDAASGGNFLQSGPVVTPRVVTAGADLNISAGQISLGFGLAA